MNDDERERLIRVDFINEAGRKYGWGTVIDTSPDRGTKALIPTALVLSHMLELNHEISVMVSNTDSFGDLMNDEKLIALRHSEGHHTSFPPMEGAEDWSKTERPEKRLSNAEAAIKSLISRVDTLEKQNGTNKTRVSNDK